MRNVIACLSAGSLLALAGAAQAAPPNPATSSIAVSASVTKNCSVGATAAAFGQYYPGTGNLSTTSTVTVKCTKGTTFTVALDKGTTTGGTIAQRLMTDGGAGDTLQYNLYKDAAWTTVWGDGTAGSQTNTGAGSGMGTGLTFTAYGLITDAGANLNAPPATYNDTVTVSVAY
ncbi:MAG TPA: spore coat U domain-containing protein [Steroidobacteraceae bacterium]|nr:spore coat U domain-containing protein [Steroidobacteraceae bacterium]